jgi:glycosyltransferase involved in cell wall biosynthesis
VPRTRIVIDWGISSFFGWGVYGLNLALQWAANPEVEACARDRVDQRQLAIDALAQRAISPFIARSEQLTPADAVHVSALGNGLHSGAGRESNAPVGVAFFELPLDAAAIVRGRRFRTIVAGSSWNERLLREAGLNRVKTILQGIDPALFHPAPKRGLFPGRFLIFSGGKAEPRKGQDLVVKAFRIFAERHPEAMLVTAWHSPWPQLAAGMDLDLSGLAHRVIDVGQLPNIAMPQVYRECDVGLFPNRAEGGTNLVAMECLACGVPAIVSRNTGHLDLVGRAGVRALREQRASAIWPGGGESDLEEMLAALEERFASRRTYFKFDNLTWAQTARKLLQTVETVHEHSDAA